MSGQGAPRTRTSPKMGPLKATVPLNRATKEGSGLRSVSPPCRRSPVAPFPKGTSCAAIRRTASLDAIYLRGLFPRENVFWHRDKATQTDKASSLDSLTLVASENVEDKLAKMNVRQRRKSSSKEPNLEKGEQTTSYHVRNPSSPISKPSASAPPKSSRSSEEGLNQEIELYAVNLAESQCDRLKEPIPEGRKAPVAELIREGPYLRTLPQATTQQNSSADFNCFGPLRDSISPIPAHLDTPHSETEDSQGSSPDQDRMFSSSSPQINRFLSRAPPDGCERVLSKSVPILRPIPREVVSHPNTLFTLKPSSHSAFESLHRQEREEDEKEKDRDSPKVPDQEDP